MSTTPSEPKGPGTVYVVENVGSDSDLLTMTVDVDAEIAAPGPLYVVNSGSVGECDMNFYGDVTSEED